MDNQQDKTPEPQKNNEHWYYTFYYNPADPRIIVPRRGLGTTLNFARLGSYLFLLGLFTMPVLIVLVVWLFKR